MSKIFATSSFGKPEKKQIKRSPLSRYKILTDQFLVVSNEIPTYLMAKLLIAFIVDPVVICTRRGGCVKFVARDYYKGGPVA